MDGDIRTLVSVTRQGDFVRSKPDIADEVMFAMWSEIIKLSPNFVD